MDDNEKKEGTAGVQSHQSFRRFGLDVLARRGCLVHRAAEHDFQAALGQQLFQSAFGDQRELPFLEAFRVRSNLRRINCPRRMEHLPPAVACSARRI